MGDVAKGLSSIFGGQQRQPVPMGGTSVLDMLLGHQSNPSADSTIGIESILAPGGPASVIPQEMPQQEQQVEVEGFAPTKRNTLGRIADGILQAYGQKPIYEGRMQERDMKRALEGFTGNPDEAISRLIQVNPQVGLPLYNQHMDNIRADRVAERQETANSLKYMGRLGGMLNAIKNSSNPEEQYGRMLPKLLEFAEKYNLPPPPTTWDADEVNTYVSANVDVDDQIRLAQLDAYRRSRLGQFDRGLDIREMSAEDLREYRGERLQQIDEAEDGRNNRAAERRGGGKAKPKVFNTRLGVAEVSPDGNQIRVNTGKDGAGKPVFQRYKRNNPQSPWIRVE